MRTANDVILNATAATPTDLFSEVVELTNLFGFSVVVKLTGGGEGFTSIEVSNDAETFVQYANSARAVSGGDNVFYNVSEVFFKYFRVKVDVASAPLTASAVYNAKGV